MEQEAPGSDSIPVAREQELGNEARVNLRKQGRHQVQMWNYIFQSMVLEPLELKSSAQSRELVINTDFLALLHTF